MAEESTHPLDFHDHDGDGFDRTVGVDECAKMASMEVGVCRYFVVVGMQLSEVKPDLARAELIGDARCVFSCFGWRGRECVSKVREGCRAIVEYAGWHAEALKGSCIPKIPCFESTMTQIWHMYMKTSTCYFLTPDHQHLFHNAHYHQFQDRDSPIAAGWFGLTHRQLRAAALHLTTSCRRAGQARSGYSRSQYWQAARTSLLHCRPQRILHDRQIHAYVKSAIGHCHLLPPPSGASTAPRVPNSELLYTVQSPAT
jgi:hypothetical protein